MNTLLSPLTVGDLPLKNRIIMAPLTRSRAGLEGIPTDLMATYYEQRAEAGLIISEGTNISPMSCAFERAPGLYSQEQIHGWRNVLDRVHAKNGKMVAQLWHSGRASAFSVLNGKDPLSPSGMNDDMDSVHVWALLDNQQYVRIAATPSRAMTEAEIQHTIGEYKQAAINAMEAGFDGVEIHAANGYLPHQFLSAKVNLREDQYGGSVENRGRFLNDILDAISEVMPLSKVGVRVSPYTNYNSALDEDKDIESMYRYVAQSLEKRGVAYLHIADVNGWFGAPDLDKILTLMKPEYHGPIIANGGLTPDSAKTLVETDTVPLVAFGRYFIANPDLVFRLKESIPLNENIKDRQFYCGGEEGYTDYPTANI